MQRWRAQYRLIGPTSAHSRCRKCPRSAVDITNKVTTYVLRSVFPVLVIRVLSVPYIFDPSPVRALLTFMTVHFERMVSETFSSYLEISRLSCICISLPGAPRTTKRRWFVRLRLNAAGSFKDGDPDHNTQGYDATMLHDPGDLFKPADICAYARYGLLRRSGLASHEIAEAKSLQIREVQLQILTRQSLQL